MDRNHRELKEKVIQKCFGISGWANIRGKLSLQGDDIGVVKADDILDKLVKDLVRFIKDEVRD